MVLYGGIRSSVSSFSKLFLADSDEAGTKTTVNVATPNFSFSADRKPSGKTSGSLKLSDSFFAAGKTLKFNSTIKSTDVQELELSTSINPELSVKVGAVSREKTLNAEGAVTDNAEASVALSYNKPTFGFTLDTKYVHQKDVQVELTGAGVYSSVTFGGKTRFDVQKQDFAAAYKNLELSGRGDFGSYTTYVTLSDKFNKLSSALEYRVPNSSDRVFAESDLFLNDGNKAKVSVGLLKTLGSGSTTAFKLSNDYKVGVVYKGRVNSNLLATVAATVDPAVPSTSKVGVNLDFIF